MRRYRRFGYTLTDRLGDAIVPAIVVVIILAVIGVIGYAIWYEVNDPGHGTITGREYTPGYVSCSGSGSSFSCTTYPECYRIKYTDGKHDGDACVSPEDYAYYRHETYYPGTDRR